MDPMSKHHSITEVRRWLELREDEGLSIKQLALRSSIPAHVFVYRANRDKRSREKSARPPRSLSRIDRLRARPGPRDH